MDPEQPPWPPSIHQRLGRTLYSATYPMYSWELIEGKDWARLRSLQRSGTWYTSRDEALEAAEEHIRGMRSRRRETYVLTYEIYCDDGHEACDGWYKWVGWLLSHEEENANKNYLDCSC